MKIPAPLLEATNGMLWVVLMFAALGAGWYVCQCARQIGSFKQLYLEQKAALAVMLTFGALAVRLANIWAQQHYRNHGFDVPLSEGAVTIVHVAASYAAVAGVLCWLRCTLPEGFGWRGWTLALVVAVGFGLAMAL